MLVVFFADRNMSLLLATATRLAIPYRRSLVWRKPPGSQFGGAARDGFWYDFELIHVYGKPTKKPGRSRNFAVLEHRTVTGQKHGCQKPLPLMETLVEAYTKKDAVVLDPFMGSGTTGVACKRLGRDFIGIEINEEYFEIAKKRIDEPVQMGLETR